MTFQFALKAYARLAIAALGLTALVLDPDHGAAQGQVGDLRRS